MAAPHPAPPGLFKFRAKVVVTEPVAEVVGVPPIEEPAPKPTKPRKSKAKAPPEPEKTKKSKKSKHRDKSPERKHKKSKTEDKSYAVWSIRLGAFITEFGKRDETGGVGCQMKIGKNFFPRMQGVLAKEEQEVLEWRDAEGTRYLPQLDLGCLNVHTKPKWQRSDPDEAEANDPHEAMLAEDDEEDYVPKTPTMDALFASLLAPTAQFHDRKSRWNIELDVYTASSGKKFVRISRIRGIPKKKKSREQLNAKQQAIARELADLVAVF
jgi:hypothetical protein